MKRYSSIHLILTPYGLIKIGEKNASVLTSYQNTKSFRWFIGLFASKFLMNLSGIYIVSFIFIGLKL